MHVGSPEWIELVIKGGHQLGVPISEHQAVQLGRHGQMLLIWNRRMNLTAITDPREIAVKHVLDSLAALPLVSSKQRLIDIGTGGGFPGLPLKILHPSQPMTLIDGSLKKINFIKHVIRELALERIEALHVRAETMAAHPDHKGRYEVVVCRAVTELERLVQMAAPLLCAHGRIIAFKGPREKACGPEVIKKLEVEHLSWEDRLKFNVERMDYFLPISDDRRSLIIFHAQ
jgi:16S rRNA (guanine527-N7)-methyltransferase